MLSIQELLSLWRWGTPSSWHMDVLPAWKLSELCTSRLFVEASSHRYDRLGTLFAFPYPGAAESSKLLIMA